MKINCRLYTPNDIDQLVALWNEHADWGVIDNKQWEKVFYHTPLGPSTIVLATEQKTNEILAQFVFIPTRISIADGELRAFKPCAPIMKKNVRKDLGLVTIFKMYKFATKYFAAEGVHLLHIMPDVRWMRAFQLIPGVQVAGFPLWCAPFDKKLSEELPDGYQIEPISPADPRIDELWGKSSRLYACGMVRNAKMLTYKLSHRNYQLVGITYKSRIIGFAAFLYKHEIKGIIICDILAENEEALKLILQITCSKAYDFKFSLPDKDQTNCEKISILATPLIEKIVSEIGFHKNDYKFSLAVHLLNKKLSKKQVNPEGWYVSAND